jgi:hypothetical protein
MRSSNKFYKMMLSWKVIAASFLILLSTIFLTPQLRHKVLSFDVSSLGTGARASWIMQAREISRRNIVRGIGLEVIDCYLKNPDSGLQRPNDFPDRTHNIIFDIILETGWVGYFICLGILGSAVGVTLLYPTSTNSICLGMLIAWIVFGFINPQGCGAHLLMLIGLFGIRRPE